MERMRSELTWTTLDYRTSGSRGSTGNHQKAIYYVSSDESGMGAWTGRRSDRKMKLKRWWRGHPLIRGHEAKAGLQDDYILGPCEKKTDVTNCG